jgi:hypothetical protein
MSSLPQFAQTLGLKPTLPQKFGITGIANFCGRAHTTVDAKDVAMYLLPNNVFELVKQGTSQGVEFLTPAEVLEWGAKLTSVFGDDWETHKYSQQRLERKAKRFIEIHNSQS